MIKLIKKLLILTLFITFFTSCSKENNDDIYISENKPIATDIVIKYNEIESEIFDLINNYRINNGLTKLHILNIISEEAISHTNYMIKIEEVNHDNFNLRHQSLTTNASAKSVGENLAYGYSTAQSVINSWLNSESHKKIIEGPNFTHFGISCKKDNNGRYYFTNIFIEK